MLKRDKIIVAVVVAQCAVLPFVMSAIQAKSDNADSPPETLQMPVSLIIGTKSDFRGNPNAPYTLVEFGDYECPPCALAHPKAVALLQKHAGQLKMQFRQFPLEQIHPLAKQAAIAAESARPHGVFWKVHDALYTRTGELEKSSIPKPSAKEVGAAEKTVKQDITDAEKIGINSTPTFVLCCPDGKSLRLRDIEQAEKYIR